MKSRLGAECRSLKGLTQIGTLHTRNVFICGHVKQKFALRFSALSEMLSSSSQAEQRGSIMAVNGQKPPRRGSRDSLLLAWMRNSSTPQETVLF